MAAAGNDCYYPNGDLYTHDSRCFSTSDPSPCCGPGRTCLTNGLCFDPSTNETGRGTCTDKTWKSSNCPQYCLQNAFIGSGAKNFAKAHPWVWPCSNAPPAQGGLMCCDVADLSGHQRPQSCCPGNDSINLFSIGSELGSPVSLITLSSSASATASFSSTSSSTPSAAPTQNHAKNNGPAIGIAVSISVAAIILIIGAFCLYRRRRNRRNAPATIRTEEVIDVKIPHQQESSTDRKPTEMPGFQGFEMPAGFPRSEMPGIQISEMPGFQGFEMSAFQGFEMAAHSKPQARSELPG